MLHSNTINALTYLLTSNEQETSFVAAAVAITMASDERKGRLLIATHLAIKKPVLAVY